MGAQMGKPGNTKALLLSLHEARSWSWPMGADRSQAEVIGFDTEPLGPPSPSRSVPWADGGPSISQHVTKSQD